MCMYVHASMCMNKTTFAKQQLLPLLQSLPPQLPHKNRKSIFNNGVMLAWSSTKHHCNSSTATRQQRKAESFYKHMHNMTRESCFLCYMHIHSRRKLGRVWNVFLLIKTVVSFLASLLRSTDIVFFMLWQRILISIFDFKSTFEKFQRK